MTVLDSDVLSDFLHGRADIVARVAAVPLAELAITAVSVEESLKGWLATVRQAEQGRGRWSLPEAYDNLTRAISSLGDFLILPYSPAADTLVTAWRAAKIRVGTRDLRIAAVAVAHGAELASRNKRDFDRVPGLELSVWN